MTISKACIIILEKKINWREILVKLVFFKHIKLGLLFSVHNYKFYTLGGCKLGQICTII
jgi:hypothetical protein